jgi:hypothetical protein
MAVGTSDYAFRHLGLDGLPGIITHHGCDAVPFITADVIELQTNDIGLSAVNTGMGR